MMGDYVEVISCFVSPLLFLGGASAVVEFFQ